MSFPKNNLHIVKTYLNCLALNELSSFIFCKNYFYILEVLLSINILIIVTKFFGAGSGNRTRTAWVVPNSGSEDLRATITQYPLNYVIIKDF